MAKPEIEKPGVVPESKPDQGETLDSEDQDLYKSGNPPIKPVTGRLPARASRS